MIEGHELKYRGDWISRECKTKEAERQIRGRGKARRISIYINVVKLRVKQITYSQLLQVKGEGVLTHWSANGIVECRSETN